MALDARDRSSIYTKLVPLLGEDDANTLMSQFPGSDADELVTRQFLRAELAELSEAFRSELQSEIGGLRSELHTEIGGLRSELHTEIGSVRTEIADLRTEVADRLRAQTAWMVGAIVGAIVACTGITATITTALG